MSDHFELGIKINGDDVKIEVSGYSDVRNALAGLAKVFSDEGYVLNLWRGLVEGNWDDDPDWDDEDEF